MEQKQTIELEQTLERTDLGHVINHNRKPIMLAGIVTVLLVIAFSFWKYQSNKSYESDLAQVYAFQTEVVDQYVDGKLEEGMFLQKIKALPSHLKGQPSLVPSLFKAVDKLTAADKTAEAVAILEGWVTQFNTGSYNYFFVASKLAPLYENVGAIDKAITLTQGLIASSVDVAKAQNYLNLGRLQMQKGDNVKAKESFEFILKNHDKSEAAKLAKLYLQQLN